MKKAFSITLFLMICLSLVGCINISKKYLKNLDGYEWLKNINSSDIEKVKIEYGGGMTYIGNIKPIYNTRENETIKEVFDFYYNCTLTKMVDGKENVADWGSTHTTFYLKNGEKKEIDIYAQSINYDGSTYYKMNGTYNIDMTKFTRTYKFVTEIQMGKLYEDMPIVGYEHYVDIPMEEIEFTELTDDSDLIGIPSIHYIETEFGKLHFLKGQYFYVELNESENVDKKIYYQLYNIKLIDLIDKYIISQQHIHQFNDKKCDCGIDVNEYIINTIINYYKNPLYDAQILYYFGEYDSCQVAIVKGDARPIMNSAIMDDIVIYFKMEHISVYRNNHYYHLQEAIDLNMLTYDSVLKIKNLYYNYLDS